MLDLLSDLDSSTGNRGGSFATGYYGYTQAVDTTGNQVTANTGGGLGGGWRGTSGGDYRPDRIYSAIFNHEMGHAYGLPHADSAADSGDYPYKMGTKNGTWSYDAVKNQLLSPLQFTGMSCDGRTVDNVCYQRTPMSGGDDDRDAKTYRWDAFSDYQAAQMQDSFLSKAIRDDSAPGGYKRWNKDKAALENIGDEERARVGTDVLKIDQQVQTVIGSVSHFNLSPTASRLYVTPAWTGNLPKQVDPTVQADLDVLNGVKPGGWNGYYCLWSGCDYTLVATYTDGTVVRVLMSMGYHQSDKPARTESGVRASARNLLDGDNLSTYAVNLPANHGGIAKVQLFNTDFGSKWQLTLKAILPSDLGTSENPLVNEWTSAAGFTGGNGAAGTTKFDNASCKNPNAVVKRPAR